VGEIDSDLDLNGRDQLTIDAHQVGFVFNAYLLRGDWLKIARAK